MNDYPLYPAAEYAELKSFALGIGRFGDAPAVTTYGSGPVSYSYRRLSEDVAAAGTALLKEGFSRKHIAVAGENGYNFIVALLAVTGMGAVAVPIDIEQSQEMILSMLRFADVECLIASAPVLALVQDELLSLPTLSLEDGGGLEEYIARGRALRQAGDRSFEEAEVSPDSTALIVYTSGTTSVPKPVMLSHRAVTLNARESIAYVDTFKTVFTSLPLHHTYGLTCGLLSNILTGRQVCVNGDIKRMVRDLSAFDPQTIMAVPLIAEMILKRIASAAGCEPLEPEKGLKRVLLQGEDRRRRSALQKAKAQLFPSLRLIICGGAHLSLRVENALFQCGVLVLQGYGITECAPLICVNRNECRAEGSVGVPLPSVELKLEDEEVLVRGPSVMQGYYKSPALTEEVLKDGWFRTGDLGSIKDGFLYIQGRCKNLIVLKNGKKISPEELEGYLSGVPMIKEVVSYGSATGSSTDDVIPAIMVYPDPAVSAGMTPYEILNELQSHVDRVNAKLPAYKQIRLINIRETPFERTTAQKIKRGMNDERRL